MSSIENLSQASLASTPEIDRPEQKHSWQTRLASVSIAMGASVLGFSGVVQSLETAQAASVVAADQNKGEAELATQDMNRPKAMNPEQQQLWGACQALRIVNHKSTGGRGPDVNTKQWILSSFRKHDWTELDVQSTRDHELVHYHDYTLNAGTNGTGAIPSRTLSYIKGLRTNHGQKVGMLEETAELLQHYRTKHIQLETKDYRGQWSTGELKKQYKILDAAGVVDRVNFSSASPRVIGWFEKNHPGVYSELIGFFDNKPSIAVAKKVKADQINVTYKAAMSGNYTQMVHKAKKFMSIRSHPDGSGDNGFVWKWAVTKSIKGPVVQIVTQGKTKAQVCQAVVKEARKKS